MDSKHFFTELKRRNVYRVGVGYAVVSWMAIQVAATIVPALALPAVITTVVVLAAVFGFPIALVLAWAFEITPPAISQDALDGPRIFGRLAGVYARIGETERALTLLEQVAAQPSGPHYGELMLGERWDPLRGNPRFEAIVASVRPLPR